MTKRLSTEQFIVRAREIHGDEYDYSKVKYIDVHTKVSIICPKHGEFMQIPSDHLNCKGCSKCRNKKRALKKRKSQEINFRINEKILGNNTL